jgi:hypothetical protein
LNAISYSNCISFTPFLLSSHVIVSVQLSDVICKNEMLVEKNSKIWIWQTQQERTFESELFSYLNDEPSKVTDTSKLHFSSHHPNKTPRK